MRSRKAFFIDQRFYQISDSLSVFTLRSARPLMIREKPAVIRMDQKILHQALFFAIIGIGNSAVNWYNVFSVLGIAFNHMNNHCKKSRSVIILLF